MKLSQFYSLCAEEFGDQFSQVLIQDFRLHHLQDKTAAELLKQGVEPKIIWLELCRQQSVPRERWSGQISKRRHAE